MDNIEQLEYNLNQFESYILRNLTHSYSICKDYENRILKLIGDIEVEHINVYSYKIRLNGLIGLVNLKF